MSADTLRRAAALMRERAAAAPASPWWAVHTKPVDDDWLVDSNGRLVAGHIGLAEDPQSKPIAEHIASWDPAVAVAVADWLDIFANYHDTGENAADETAAALAVARTYLGEPA